VDDDERAAKDYRDTLTGELLLCGAIIYGALVAVLFFLTFCLVLVLIFTRDG